MIPLIVASLLIQQIPPQAPPLVLEKNLGKKPAPIKAVTIEKTKTGEEYLVVEGTINNVTLDKDGKTLRFNVKRKDGQDWVYGFVWNEERIMLNLTAQRGVDPKAVAEVCSTQKNLSIKLWHYKQEDRGVAAISIIGWTPKFNGKPLPGWDKIKHQYSHQEGWNWAQGLGFYHESEFHGTG